LIIADYVELGLVRVREEDGDDAYAAPCVAEAVVEENSPEVVNTQVLTLGSKEAEQLLEFRGLEIGQTPRLADFQLG
jgi:hypothetical protein